MIWPSTSSSVLVSVSATLHASRRASLALLAQQSAAIDAAAAGEGWLKTELTAQGYSGPGLAEIKEEEQKLFKTLGLLSAKPVLYVANVEEAAQRESASFFWSTGTVPVA